MTVTAPEKTAVVPFSLRDTPSLIEKAWPTAKISAETQKERKAVQGQTLTGLGSYWKGRKPLILTRACVLAALMPATDDLERDVEIFEKLMGMADETFGSRFEGGPTAFAKLFPDHALEVADNSGRSWVWRDDLDPRERQRRIAHAFMDLPYIERLEKVKRPEELAEIELINGIWDEVNVHLGTNARTMSGLVEQLGIMRFGRRPLLADTFSGSGSIPFEAARIGCDVIASDLNPIACMLSWASFNIVGASPERHAQIVREMREIADRVDRVITEIGIEHDAQGNRAKLYLYCVEVRCPRTGWMVPVSPTWMLSKKRNTIARLTPDHTNKRYEIEILNGVTDEEVEAAETGTLRSGRLHHPILNDDLGISMKEIRGDFRDDEGASGNKLRPWEKDDVRPRPDDVFQERLYAIQWMDAKDIKKGKANPRTWFASATAEDLAREDEVAEYVERHLAGWQRDGFVSDMEIEPGNKTDEPIRTRGWTYWHHLFCPRQILFTAITLSEAKMSPEGYAFTAKFIDWNSKLCRYGTGAARESVAQTFYNQALNAFPNYGVRSYGFARS